MGLVVKEVMEALGWREWDSTSIVGCKFASEYAHDTQCHQNIPRETQRSHMVTQVSESQQCDRPVAGLPCTFVSSVQYKKRTAHYRS
jgi:hypothetical protein